MSYFPFISVQFEHLYHGGKQGTDLGLGLGLGSSLYSLSTFIMVGSKEQI